MGAPLRLRIVPSRFMMEDNDGVETLRQDRLRIFLTGLCAQFKGERPVLLVFTPLVATCLFTFAKKNPMTLQEAVCHGVASHAGGISFLCDACRYQ